MKKLKSLFALTAVAVVTNSANAVVTIATADIVTDIEIGTTSDVIIFDALIVMGYNLYGL